MRPSSHGAEQAGTMERRASPPVVAGVAAICSHQLVFEKSELENIEK